MRRDPPARGAALTLVGACLVAALACAKPAAPAAPPSGTTDAQGVTLAAQAPQWKYLTLAVAAARDPLPPLPIPSRVAVDERRSASVGSPLAGRIEAVRVRLGERLKAGDPLFSVRSGAFAELNREAEASHAQVEVRRRLAERARELLELKVGSQKDVLAAEAELREAELAARAAEAKSRSLQVGSAGDNAFWVKAPRAGTVVELDVAVGQEVTPDRDRPLLRLAELSEVLVVADVPEADVAEFAVGAKVTIHAAAGELEREGVVEAVSELVDPKRHSVEVRVRAPNDDRALRPNAYVEVLPRADPTRQVVCVPDVAVVTQGARLVVFVARGEGRLEPVPVVVGRRRDGLTEIRRGLDVGTSFVASGALLLLNQIELAGGP